MAMTQTAEMTSRLKAALPTMVEAPSGPRTKPPAQISMTFSRISGAEEPRAMSVRFATVSFQTLTVLTVPVFLLTIIRFLEVTFSMPAMKTSATMATPRKLQKSRSRYGTALATGVISFSQARGRK